ncbi:MULTISPECIES: hypothetical protein [Delftia]|jgi:hypothetical protein|uniref:hypothetical protein n=1 Tax=unclassified Delftia TaxID=2613839 RepID=UPI00114F23F6|nr:MULTISPECIES: hypothetical protein [unclassified Delftia]MBD9582946.1 hypothetical protein [Delftia sp. DLF01]MCB4786037.1 hypothetical protein [Delftia sp. Lp-1]TQL80390.1 hypothetical protein FB549_1916 [Delftia sp. HK171]
MLLTYEEFPTLLTMPRWFGTPEVKVMPGKPEDYFIEQLHPDWFLVYDSDGDMVYSGVGPVSVQQSNAPF